MNNEQDLESSLVIRTSKGEKATFENLPAAAMQALYHQITGKREKLVQHHDKNYIIDQASIEQLSARLYQTLDQFQFKGTSVTIDIVHFNKDRLTCSSLEKFRQYDQERTDPTSAIVLTMSFLIAAPIAGEYQNYDVQVTFNSYVHRKSDRFAMYSHLGKRRDDEHAISVSIDYIDYVIARSFKSTIDEWVDSLEKLDIFSLPLWLRNFSYSGRDYCGLVASLGVVFSCYYAFAAAATVSLLIILTLLSVWAISFLLWRDLSEFSIDILGGYGTFPFVLLNKGDRRNHEVFLRRRRRASSLGWFLLGTCLVPLFVGLAASAIYGRFVAG